MNTPQSGQNSGEGKKPDLPEDLLLELGADDEAELLPDHLVPDGEDAAGSGVAPAAPSAPDKSKALQGIASQLAFAEAMASATASKEFALPKAGETAKQEPAAKQNTPAAEPPLAKLAETALPAPPPPPPPAPAPASGAQSASPPAAEKSGGLKIPKFLKRTFEAAALKGFAAQLFGDDSSATSDSSPAPPAPQPPVQPLAQPASTAAPPVAPQPVAQAPVQPAPVPPPVPRPSAQPAVQPQSSAVPPAVPRPVSQAPAQPASAAAPPAALQPVAQSPVQPASRPPVPPPVPRLPAQPAVQPQSSAVPPVAPQPAPEYAAVKVPKFLKKSFEANALKGFAAQLFGPEEGETASTATSSTPANSAASQPPVSPEQPESGVPPAGSGLNQSSGAIKVPRFLKRTFEANAMKGISAQLFEDDGSATSSAALGTAGGQPSAAATPPAPAVVPSAAQAPATQNPQPAPAASTPGPAPAPVPATPVQPPEMPAKQTPTAEVQSSAPQATAPEPPPFENLSPGPPPIPKKKSTAELWNPYGHEEDESDLLPDHLVPASETSETTSTAAPGKSSPTKVPKFLKKSFESTALKNIATQIWGEEAVSEVVGPEPIEVSTPEGAAPTTEAGARWLAENAAVIEAAGAAASPSPNSAKEAAEAFEQMMRDRGVIPKEVKKTHLDPEAMRDFAKYTKTKEEERLKFELEFRSEPTVAKPSCPIENYTKASECPVKWDEMVGKTRVRFCEKCEQQVYDLSKLDQAEAEELIVKREGKSDLTYYRRADGKWQIKDCPVGAAKKSKLKLTFGIAGGAVVLLIGLFVMSFFNKPPQQAVVDDQTSYPQTSSTTSSSTSKPVSNAPKPIQAQPKEVYIAPLASNEPLTASQIPRGELPEKDEYGVLTHPYVDRRIVPEGGYSIQPAPREREPWDD